jgi:hypothetical protein
LFRTIGGIGLLVGGAKMAIAQPTRPIGYLQEYISPRIARCLIERDPEVIAKWLRLLPGSRDEVRWFRKVDVRFDACFERYFHLRTDFQPEYNVVSMRAGLIRARLLAGRDRFPTQPPESGGRPAWYAASEDASDPLVSPAIQAVEIGACLARKHWTAVVTLVTVVDPASERANMDYGGSGRPESEGQRMEVRKAVGEVIPSIAGCVPSGVKLTMDVERLRTLLEEAAYHMVVDTGTPGLGAAGR